MRLRGASLLLLLAACGSEGAVVILDGGVRDADGTSPDDASADAGADGAFATDAEAGADRDAAPDGGADGAFVDAGLLPICANVDAGSTLLFCESFDRSTNVPAPFAPVLEVGAVEVGASKSFSAPNALRAYFPAAGDYSAATGAAIRATRAVAGASRVRLSLLVQLDGTFHGETDFAQITWSSATASYSARFGSSGGSVWMFQSTDAGYLSFTAFPTGAWYRFVIVIDLTTGAFTTDIGGVRAFDDLLTLPPEAPSTYTSIELALGIPAISALAQAGSSVHVDDVVMTSF